jgi:hypothetical protein
MPFTFSEDARRETPTGRPSSSGWRSASTTVLPVFRGASSNPCSCSGPPLERWVEACYFERTRFESVAEDATSAALDRGREWRD